jgi:hypothetical protein
MAARPEDRLEWATDTFFEVRDLGTGDGEQAYANKFPVPEQVQRTGFKVRQDWYRPFINTILNNIFSYIAHLDDRYSVGDTHTTTSAEDATAISVRLGGTWILVGTETLAGEVNNVFRKTV